MNEHYKNFDELDRHDLETELITTFEREVDIIGEPLETLRECAWVCYAGTCGLEFHGGTLMQFGDGGYPYLYTSPADGGDDLCHVCATKELKKGASVAWSHHMEGEVEHCADCNAEIKPFSARGPYGMLSIGAYPIGCVESFTPGPPKVPEGYQLSVDWGAAGGDRSAHTLLVGGAKTIVMPLESVKVNWPLLARTIEEQAGADLTEEQRAAVEEMKRRPNDFADEENEGADTVECKFCHNQVHADDAHLHQGSWVGVCCWDERLKMTE